MEVFSFIVSLIDRPITDGRTTMMTNKRFSYEDITSYHDVMLWYDDDAFHSFINGIDFDSSCFNLVSGFGITLL